MLNKIKYRETSSGAYIIKWGKQYHTVRTISKSNIKIVERATHIHGNPQGRATHIHGNPQERATHIHGNPQERATHIHGNPQERTTHIHGNPLSWLGTYAL